MKALRNFILSVETWMSGKYDCWELVDESCNILSFDEVYMMSEFLRRNFEGQERDSEFVKAILETYKSWLNKSWEDKRQVEEEIIEKFGEELRGTLMDHFGNFMDDANATERQMICAKLRDAFDALVDAPEEECSFEDVFFDSAMIDLEGIIGKDGVEAFDTAIENLNKASQAYRRIP